MSGKLESIFKVWLAYFNSVSVSHLASDVPECWSFSG